MAVVVVVGSSNTDMVAPVPHIPGVGETVLGSDLIIAPGGKGANQAVAAARLGAEVRFIGAVGDDAFGSSALAGLREEGIDVGLLRTVRDVPSGVALITVDREGRNAIAVAPGANAHVTESDVRDAAGEISGADVLLVQLETPLDAVREALRVAWEAGVRTVLNPAPVPSSPGVVGEMLAMVSVLTPNEGEARELAGVAAEAGPEAVARELLALGAGAVIITLSERVALVTTQDRQEMVSAHEVRAVDTTAAGDAFSGALSVALAEGQDIFEAARFASAAAALSVTKRGAQPSLPSREAVEKALYGQLGL